MMRVDKVKMWSIFSFIFRLFLDEYLLNGIWKSLKIIQSFHFLLDLHLKNLIPVEHSVSCNNHWLRWSVSAV